MSKRSVIFQEFSRSAASAATKLNHKGHKGHKERTQKLTVFSLACDRAGFVLFVAFVVKKIPGLRQGWLRGCDSFPQ